MSRTLDGGMYITVYDFHWEYSIRLPLGKQHFFGSLCELFWYLIYFSVLHHCPVKFNYFELWSSTIPFYSIEFLSPVVKHPYIPAYTPGSTFTFLEVRVVPQKLSPSIPVFSSILSLPGAIQLWKKLKAVQNYHVLYLFVP